MEHKTSQSFRKKCGLKSESGNRCHLQLHFMAEPNYWCCVIYLHLYKCC